MRVTPQMPVGVIVADHIGRARIFEDLRIDYCCHGTATLAQACAQRSLNVERVVSEIVRSDFQDAYDVLKELDYATMSPGKLADHIVASHHAYLRRELPRLARLVEKVIAAHGAGHPDLEGLRATFARLRGELESHLLKEERVLFPLIKQLEAASRPFRIPCGTVANPVRVMAHVHDAAGAALRRLRTLTGDYRVPPDACGSFRALYEGLAALEADLHRHIHKENNILFPRAAALEARLLGNGRNP